MAEHGKYCPIMVAGSNRHIKGECIGKDCAWFFPFANDCTLNAIAVILTDSMIDKKGVNVSKATLCPDKESKFKGWRTDNGNGMDQR